MACHRIGDKPLSEPILTRFTKPYIWHSGEISCSPENDFFLYRHISKYIRIKLTFLSLSFVEPSTSLTIDEMKRWLFVGEMFRWMCYVITLISLHPTALIDNCPACGKSNGAYHEYIDCDWINCFDFITMPNILIDTSGTGSAHVQGPNMVIANHAKVLVPIGARSLAATMLT